MHAVLVEGEGGLRRRCRSPHRGAELAPLSHVDPGPRVKGFEGIAPLMCPCCVEDVTCTEGPALAGNVPTSQLLPLCHMMRTVCVWRRARGLRRAPARSAARTPFPVIGSGPVSIKMSANCN
jgi:hypothetical protein